MLNQNEGERAWVLRVTWAQEADGDTQQTSSVK